MIGKRTLNSSMIYLILNEIYFHHRCQSFIGNYCAFHCYEVLFHDIRIRNMQNVSFSTPKLQKFCRKLGTQYETDLSNKLSANSSKSKKAQWLEGKISWNARSRSRLGRWELGLIRFFIYKPLKKLNFSNDYRFSNFVDSTVLIFW